MELVTAEQMREMDNRTINRFGIPGLVLMENAARGAVRVLWKHMGNPQGKQVGILAGSGNNGGDGFVMARYLYLKGAVPTVFLLAKREKIKGDAAHNLSLLSTLPIPLVDVTDEADFHQSKAKISHQDLFVDAIFGTGLNTDIRGHYTDVIAHVNALGKPVLSVDIPSGIDADSGRICGTCIRADVTATFAFAKPGHVVHPGCEYTGETEIIDIGIPHHIKEEVNPDCFLLTSRYLRPLFPARQPEAHKGHTGHMLLLAGSPGKTGAAAMAVTSALRSGAGLVTLACPQGIHPVMETLVLEGMTFPLPQTPEGDLSDKALGEIASLMADKRCMALGPGMGTSSATATLVREIILTSFLPLVIDADGLNCIAEDTSILKEAEVPLILTPHPGEMARLSHTTTREVQQSRIRIARDFAATHNVYLVLKGAGTLIAHPDGRLWINPTGNSGMASAGMGDVLTGMIAGFLSQGMSPLNAAIMAVYLHGKAADTLAASMGPVGFLASDVIERIPGEIGRLIEPHGHPKTSAFSTRLCHGAAPDRSKG